MKTDAATTSLWLIEGPPGSGKTETARLLCDAVRARGFAAQWWLEEMEHHPVTPRSLRKLAESPEFPSLCANSIRQFLAREKGGLILEGVIFQSILRFLFARDAGTAELTQALKALAAVLATAEVRLLLLRVDDPGAHYGGFVRPRRGEDWMSKLTAYVEQTPIAKRRGWKGFEGFVSFWSEYQALSLQAAPLLNIHFHQAPSPAAGGEGLTEDIRQFFQLT